MATFYYEGFTKDGKAVKGVVEGASQQLLLTELSSKGILVSEIKVHKIKTKRSFLGRLFSSRKNLGDYFFQLSLLLRSGIPLVDAQNIIAESTKSEMEKNIILQTTALVSQGVKFSDALEKHEDYYDPMYVNLVRVAENIGRLPNVLMDIAKYEQSKKDNADTLKSALIYPIVVLTLGICILTFLLAFIVPRIQSIFSSIKQELPTSTKLLLIISDMVRKYGLIIFILVAISLITFRYLYRTNEKLRYKVDKKLYSINIISQVLISRFAHILAFQLREGLPLTDALKHATQTVKNTFVQETLSDVRDKVVGGVKFSDAVKQAAIFPDIFPAAVSTGESSGNMPDLLDRIAEFYDMQINKYTSAFLSIIEPLLIVVIGGLVGFVVISIMMPLFSMNTMVG